jgi:hypothetical protein
MKILLIHPEDDPEIGPWAGSHWDRIVDLGLGGKTAYQRWGRRFGCPVESLGFHRRGMEDLYRVRDLLAAGDGRFIDNYGLDWWEIMCVYPADDLDLLVLLRRFAQSISSHDELYFSRACLHAGVLRAFGYAVQIDCSRRKMAKRIRQYVRAVSRLSSAQLTDVICDKLDPGFQYRGRFASQPQPAASPVVLLPSAYINVSRTAVAYAKSLPQLGFLLLAVRQSARIENLPDNVVPRWLSSYASVRDRTDENADLERQWRSLAKDLIQLPEFEILHRIGSLDNFWRRCRHGLELRDAWLNVFDSEPVQAILCADDANPSTHIPMLLARERGLPNIACHHGALDGSYSLKRSYADVILAKGRMENDYLERRCKVPPENLAIAPAGLPARVYAGRREGDRTLASHILFISEPFEATGGRAQEFYRDVLPPLADLAMSAKCKLVVKLHPAESRSERARMVERVLSPRQREVAEVVAGPMSDELLSRSWFGVTVISTVATECAIRGILCFLCRWLAPSSYGYLEQFVSFGVGIGLNDPDKIMQIPELLREYAASSEVVANCWQGAGADALISLLNSSRRSYGAAAS